MVTSRVVFVSSAAVADGIVSTLATHVACTSTQLCSTAAGPQSPTVLN